MYDLTSLYTTIVGCSATIIAIIGGFIASKLIALSSERAGIESRLKEHTEQISFKDAHKRKLEKTLEDSDAFDFIKDHAYELLDGKVLDNICAIDEPPIPINQLRPYWDRARRISKRIASLSPDDSTKSNADGVPLCLEEEYPTISDYSMCRLLFEKNCRLRKYQYETTAMSLLGQRSNLSAEYPNDILLDGCLGADDYKWYRDMRDEINKIATDLDWLVLVKKQLINQLSAVQKPKGMKAGMVLFAVFAIVGILIPLILLSHIISSAAEYQFLRWGMISAFFVCLLATFLYLKWLLGKDTSSIKKI